MDKEWLQTQVENGRADKDIAAQLNVSVHVVGYWRRKFEIAPRSASERVKSGIKDRWPNGRRGPDAANWRGGRRSTSSGYIRIYAPDHPAAVCNGWVYEHRLVMEQKIGRLLKPGELVDHIDRNRSNNHPDNLRLQASRSAHVKDHFSARDQLVKANQEIERLSNELAEARGIIWGFVIG
jgi:hypothetical protein